MADSDEKKRTDTLDRLFGAMQKQQNTARKDDGPAKSSGDVDDFLDDDYIPELDDPSTYDPTPEELNKLEEEIMSEDPALLSVLEAGQIPDQKDRFTSYVEDLTPGLKKSGANSQSEAAKAYLMGKENIDKRRPGKRFYTGAAVSLVLGASLIYAIGTFFSADHNTVVELAKITNTEQASLDAPPSRDLQPAGSLEVDKGLEYVVIKEKLEKKEPLSSEDLSLSREYAELKAPAITDNAPIKEDTIRQKLDLVKLYRGSPDNMYILKDENSVKDIGMLDFYLRSIEDPNKYLDKLISHYSSLTQRKRAYFSHKVEKADTIDNIMRRLEPNITKEEVDMILRNKIPSGIKEGRNYRTIKEGAHLIITYDPAEQNKQAQEILNYLRDARSGLPGKN